MSKRKSPYLKSLSPSEGPASREQQRSGHAAAGDPISRHVPSPAAIRETIESVVIAIVLAFLFRTFEAEAFVIPTGSMAPTLMGRHKDLVCPKCGCPYQVSASDEVDQDSGALREDRATESGTCPMCRYTDDNLESNKYPSYNGDRILVEKFAYQLGDPKRFDVIVFKFPGDPLSMPAAQRSDARTNFIKRLVGLPGETVRIQHGDLWIARGSEAFHIARKAPKKLLAMMQPVFNNDYMSRIAEYGWPARWQAEPGRDGSAAGGWASDDSTTFQIDGAGSDAHWLRYHHRVPSYQQWVDVLQNGDRSHPNVAPQLITDFTAYNTNSTRSEPEPDSFGQHWVGDLAVSCTADVESRDGELLLELRKGGRQFLCRINVATGVATLAISGADMAEFRPTAHTSIRAPGRYDLRFSNCDNELRLWVDGSVVPFDAPTSYDDLGNHLPDQSDLEPVGVASVGAKMRLSHLAIYRDIYYLAMRGDPSAPRATEFCDIRFRPGEAYPQAAIVPSIQHVDFALHADQFFVLGDNSAKSKDGRLWGPDNYWVPRDLLIGKALFVYWPHSWDELPYVHIPFPYFPNFARMRLVR